MFQNVNSIGTCEETNKKEIIREFINDYKMDCFAIAEVNVNWKVRAKKQLLQSYFKDNFKNSSVSTVHNIWGNTEYPHQQGGVGKIVTGDMALRIQCSEQDKSKMGR